VLTPTEKKEFDSKVWVEEEHTRPTEVSLPLAVDAVDDDVDDVDEDESAAIEGGSLDEDETPVATEVAFPVAKNQTKTPSIDPLAVAPFLYQSVIYRLVTQMMKKRSATDRDFPVVIHRVITSLNKRIVSGNRDNLVMNTLYCVLAGAMVQHVERMVAVGSLIPDSDAKRINEKLRKLTGGILPDALEPDWIKGVVFGGTALLHCLRDLPGEPGDIDLFILNRDSDVLQLLLFRLYRRIRALGNTRVILVQYAHVYTIVCVEPRCRIQIIMDPAETACELVRGFDLDYVRCFYTGQSQAYLFPECYLALKTQSISFGSLSLKQFRLDKAVKKGFGLDSLLLQSEKPKHQPFRVIEHETPQSRRLREQASLGWFFPVAEMPDEQVRYLYSHAFRDSSVYMTYEDFCRETGYPNLFLEEVVSHTKVATKTLQFPIGWDYRQHRPASQSRIEVRFWDDWSQRDGEALQFHAQFNESKNPVFERSDLELLYLRHPIPFFIEGKTWVDEKENSEAVTLTLPTSKHSETWQRFFKEFGRMIAENYKRKHPQDKTTEFDVQDVLRSAEKLERKKRTLATTKVEKTRIRLKIRPNTEIVSYLGGYKETLIRSSMESPARKRKREPEDDHKLGWMNEKYALIQGNISLVSLTREKQDVKLRISLYAQQMQLYHTFQHARLSNPQLTPKVEFLLVKHV
jgi:hypothetical protein